MRVMNCSGCGDVLEDGEACFAGGEADFRGLFEDISDVWSIRGMGSDKTLCEIGSRFAKSYVE